MADFDRVRAVKNSARHRLLAMPGVHAVGVGVKVVGGKRTTEPAIVVLVVKKKPLSELSPQERIPPEIDGVKTDVVEREMPKLHQGADGDETRYRPLVGGIQIWAGKSTFTGTMGCIMRTIEPDPRIMAVTCHHVVAEFGGKASDLDVTVSGDQHHVTFGGSPTPGSIVRAHLTVFATPTGPSQPFDVYVRTVGTDKLTDVAERFTTEINSLGTPLVTATRSIASVTINWIGPDTIALLDVGVFGPQASDGGTDLNVDVAGQVITLSGAASDDLIGIYTWMNNSGGAPATQGVFTEVPEDASLTDIAGMIASSINAPNIPGVHATASGAQVTVAGAQALECVLSADIRVGQPSNDFSSDCCGCCDQRIGVVAASRVDIDCALVQLDPGLEYKAEIAEIGIVTGSHDVTSSEAMSGTYAVRKRGKTTGLTNGFVDLLDVDGFIAGPTTDGSGQVAPRTYRTIMTVVPADPKHPFSDHGDSGSAVVNAAGEVVGILFGGSPSQTLVTPIQQIESALNLSVATATALGQIKTVPPRAGARAEVPGAARRRGKPAGPTWDLIQQLEAQIATTPAGKSFVDIVRRHAMETSLLVNHNRRVGAAWQRNGGPELVQALFRTLRDPSIPLPGELAGKPLNVCLQKMAAVLRLHASAELISDMDSLLVWVDGMGGKNYPELLTRLQVPPEPRTPEAPSLTV